MLRGRYEMDGKKVDIYLKKYIRIQTLYFTEEVMQKLDDIAREEYSYG